MQKSQVNNFEMDVGDRDSTNSDINTITAINTDQHNPLTFNLEVENILVHFEVDTGACVTVMCRDEYSRFFSHIPYANFSKFLSTISGHQLVDLGTITVKVKLGSRQETLDIVIIDSPIYFCALIGRNWLDILMPHWRTAFHDDDALFKVGEYYMSSLVFEMR